MALLCVLALALVPCAQGLYFTMPQGDKKCFIEEVPEETVVVGVLTVARAGKYNLEVHDDERNVYVADPSVGIHITIKNPEGEEIMDKTYKDSPGRFAFTSAVPGEHVICLSTESVWFGGKDLRIHLDLAMGESSNDYDEIRKRDKLDDLQLRVRQLLDQVDQIQKEQAYQRVREARFRDTSESTNWRVVYWSVIQLAILLALLLVQELDRLPALAFPTLLDDAPSSVIRWDPSGDSFLVVNADVLASTVLPDYFKHANFSSFLRQLNMYNFTKQPQQQRPGSRRHQQHWRFSHADFKRGRLDLLPRIHRKTFGPGSCHTVESLTAALEQVQAGCSEAKDGLDELQATATLLRSQHQFLQEHQAATSTHVTEVHNNVELLVQMLSRLCGFDPAQHFSTTTAPLTGMPPPPSLLAPWCTISSAPPSPAHSEQDSVGSPAGATDSGLEDNVGDDEELMLVKTEPGLDLDDELFGLEGDSMACLLHWPSDQHVH